jgi:hypothetical protein
LPQHSNIHTGSIHTAGEDMSKREKNRFMDMTVFRNPEKTGEANQKETVPEPTNPVLPADFSGTEKKESFFAKFCVKIRDAAQKMRTWCGGGLPAIRRCCSLFRLPKFQRFLFRKKDAETAVPADDFREEEMTALPKWWSIGIKFAAAAAVVLMLTGGYVLYRGIIGRTVPAAEEPVAGIASEPDQESVQNRPPLPVAAPPSMNSLSIGSDLAASPAEAKPVIAPVSVSPADATTAAAVPDDKAVLAPPSALPAAPSVPAPAIAAADPFAAAENLPEPPLSDPKPENMPEQNKTETAETAAATPPIPEALPADKPPVSPTPPAPPIPPVPAELQAGMQELVPLEPNVVATAETLKPLTALDSPILFASSAVPAAAESPAAAKTADRYDPANKVKKNHTPNRKPTPPSVNEAITPTALVQTVPIIEPVKEIIPKIPHTGTVQDAPRPALAVPVSSMPVAPQPVQVQTTSAYAKESVPLIPKDRPAETANVVTVPEPAADESKTLPMGMQLREHIQELRAESHPQTEERPVAARLDTAETAEPALRYTPKQTRSSLPAEPAAAAPSVGTFAVSLLPGSDELNPQSEEIAKALPMLASAPQAVMDVPLPAYRTTASPAPATPAVTSRSVNREAGLTFRNRMENERKTAVKYIVQEGDTVFRLATDKLNDTARWREIVAINSDRIQDVRRLQPGMEILLPATVSVK